MNYNRPALLIIISLYFIFLLVGMSWWGDTLDDFGIDSDYKITDPSLVDNSSYTDVDRGESISFLKNLRTGITNLPIYLNLIFFGLPSILFLLVILSFFTAD